eukprot:COSAG03_NODE_84_length_13698_cov_22.852857_9_plen_37_part_01
MCVCERERERERETKQRVHFVGASLELRLLALKANPV